MFRVAIALSLAVFATGCATGVSRELPKCNGAAKRPLNAGLWIPQDPKLAGQARSQTGDKLLFDRQPAEVTRQPATVTPYGRDMRSSFPAAGPVEADRLAALSLEPC